jgi:hypothetical protein
LLAVQPATAAHRTLAVQPATAAHRMLAVQPATAAHRMLAVQPATAAHQKHAVQRATAAHRMLAVQPSTPPTACSSRRSPGSGSRCRSGGRRPPDAHCPAGDRRPPTHAVQPAIAAHRRTLSSRTSRPTASTLSSRRSPGSGSRCRSGDPRDRDLPAIHLHQLQPTAAGRYHRPARATGRPGRGEQCALASTGTRPQPQRRALAPARSHNVVHDQPASGSTRSRSSRAPAPARPGSPIAERPSP